MEPSKTTSRIGGWLALALFVVLGVAGILVWAGRMTLRGVERTGEQIVRIAESFRTGSITTTFVAALPQLETDGSGRLELATSTVVETFTRTDERRILWDRVALGETVVEIRAPVTYRYHVRLDDPWRLELTDQTCIVHAPTVRPSLPPAVHTDGIEKRVSTTGWFAIDVDDSARALERSLTPIVSEWAGDARHMAAVRDSARRTVAAFVRGWLLREDQWRDDGVRAVIVRFPDDPPDKPRFPDLIIDD